MHGTQHKVNYKAAVMGRERERVPQPQLLNCYCNIALQPRLHNSGNKSVRSTLTQFQVAFTARLKSRHLLNEQLGKGSKLRKVKFSRTILSSLESGQLRCMQIWNLERPPPPISNSMSTFQFYFSTVNFTTKASISIAPFGTFC